MVFSCSTCMRCLNIATGQNLVARTKIKYIYPTILKIT
uniref:Uncharacterized protein n=1 Tax=Arundo donax TaxID=35708 RepID=A0A0A9EFG7_ARUDO